MRKTVGRIPEGELGHPKVPLSGQGELACLLLTDSLFEAHSSPITQPVREGSNKRISLASNGITISRYA